MRKDLHQSDVAMTKEVRENLHHDHWRDEPDFSLQIKDSQYFKVRAETDSLQGTRILITEWEMNCRENAYSEKFFEETGDVALLENILFLDEAISYLNPMTNKK